MNGTGGIPTKYEGIEFRSRLEAKWAAFFTRIGWEWTYEPFDGNGYIPDFLIHGPNPLLVEVKPAATWDEYHQPIEKLESGVAGIWEHDLLVVGTDPIVPSPVHRREQYLPVVGLLGEHNPDGWAWDTGVWLRCLACQTLGIYHQSMGWMGRPCGHYDGDGYLGSPDMGAIGDKWNDATNEVKWRRIPTPGSHR